jgi:hypothetical protein
VGTGFFGRVIALDNRGSPGGEQLGRVADDAGPHRSARLVEGAAEEPSEPRKVLHHASAHHPEIGGDRVASCSQRQAVCQGREELPRRGDKKALKQYHDERPNGRRQSCAHGNILQEANTLGQTTILLIRSTQDWYTNGPLP